MPTTHTAVATTAKGVLEEIQVPTAAPGPTKILVKIEYASVAPFDVSMIDLGRFIQSYPERLGFDAAGTVIKVGSEVKNLVVGDRVRTGVLDRFELGTHLY